MSKKESKLVAVVLLAAVVAICLYFVPRLVARTPNIPEKELASISGYTSYKGLSDEKYKTEEPQEMVQFLEAVQALRIRYDNKKDIYEVGDVCADVVVRFEDGGHWKIVLSDNGLVRWDNKNYRCEDGEALKDLLEQIKSWKIS